MIWIFLIEGLIAGTCAWAFNRLSRVHNPGNGAAYIYVRSTWGKFWGWFVSFLQYTTLPIIVTSQIVSMVRLNFVGSGTFLDTAALLGPWANLTWDIVGIIIYMIVSCTLFLGMKMLKRFINISGYIKWGSTFLLVGALIAMFILNGSSAWETNTDSKHMNLTLHSFTTAFTSCFFFFMGFETYATMGNNVENPEKNIGRSVLWTMFLATVFYVIVTILFLGAIAGSFSNNPNLQVFKLLGDKTGKWFEVAGVIIMLICTMSLKMNAAMQNALYSGTILEPFATEGIFHEKYKKLNKDGIPFRASLLNLFITFCFAFIWLIIPDIIQGILGYPEAVFSYARITEETSLIMIIIFSFVIATALRLGYTKQMKVKWWEYAIWAAGLLFLLFQLEEFFRALITSFITNGQKLNAEIAAERTKGIIEIVSASLELALIAGIFAFAILWYKLRYEPLAKKRLVENPLIQQQLDQHFVVIPDAVD